MNSWEQSLLQPPLVAALQPESSTQRGPTPRGASCSIRASTPCYISTQPGVLPSLHCSPQHKHSPGRDWLCNVLKTNMRSKSCQCVGRVWVTCGMSLALFCPKLPSKCKLPHMQGAGGSKKRQGSSLFPALSCISAGLAELQNHTKVLVR